MQSKATEYVLFILSKIKGNTQVRFAEADVTYLKLFMNVNGIVEQGNYL